MSLNINKLSFLLFYLFIIGCNNDPVNLNSNEINTNLDVARFDIDSGISSYSYQVPLDSLDISASSRLYAFSDVHSNNSSIFLNFDISEINQESGCLSDSISLIKIELSSLNFFIVFFMIPFNAPFHPECAHAIIFLLGS